MSCWLRASSPITARLLGRIERQDRALVLEQHHLVARGVAGRGDAIGPQHLLLGLRGIERRVRVLEQACAELDPQILRTASSIRFLEMRCCASSCAPKSRIRVLVISESTPEFSASAAASGPSAATPCPHSPASGVFGGHARISDTAVQSLSTKPSKPHSPLRIWFIR